MNRNNTFENLIFDGMINSISQKYFPPSFPLHWHNDIEVLFLDLKCPSSECVIIQLEESEVKLHRGDILIVWPGELHEIKNNLCGQLAAIQFSPQVLNERIEFASAYHLFRKKHLICFDSDKNWGKPMQTYLNEALQIRKKKAAFWEVELLTKLYAFFVFYGRYVNECIEKEIIQETETISSVTRERIHSMCFYIEQNCQKNLTLESVAEVSGFSRFYFSRVFKQITSYSFVEYLNIQRIQHAAELLSDISQPITDIAFKVGFNSISSFNRAFKNQIGYSPRQYRSFFSNET